MPAITTFLMFEGDAEAAMNLYVSLFPNSAITHIDRYGEGEDGVAGTVRVAHFTLDGQPFMCIDSYVQHAFSFTPAISLYVACDTESEVDALFARLSEGGKVLMPLAPYPFSPKFAWINDRYGVSWQLTLAANS
jgi:predicted 3-demethylubiquinone-9 3-methyltransferase (glyoxalase superfamily)